jgi:hypothetical protein
MCVLTMMMKEMIVIINCFKMYPDSLRTFFFFGKCSLPFISVLQKLPSFLCLVYAICSD